MATSSRGPDPPAARSRQLSLFETGEAPAVTDRTSPPPDPDAAARAFAVDPNHHVVLEASAGTGKTSVLVTRYVNLLKAGVDPANILAITFTRKAAAEMRERILRELRAAGERSEFDQATWQGLRDRVGEIAISTIDAFCLALLREFPLEADVEPGFDLANETEVPRLLAAALDRTLRLLVTMSGSDDDIALVLAQLGTTRTREGLGILLDRRLVAWDALNRFLERGPRGLTAAGVSHAAASALRTTLLSIPGGLAGFLEDGPEGHPRYGLFRREVRQLDALDTAPDAAIRAVLDRVSGHFLTTEGKARKPGTAIPPYRADHYPSKGAMKRHRDALFEVAPRIEAVMFAFNRDLNVVLARGVRRMFAIALEQYRRTLDERSVLDFSDVLQRAVDLLRRMEEFSQSRFRLESRYHHVLVDEFQDTSRAQWELVSLLVQAWGEGLGLASSPSIFIVGDRKQSIYRFRDAEVSVLHEAAEYIDGLRPGTRSRRSIARSFRARPELLHFVNDVFSEISRPTQAPGDFTYEDHDRFPVGENALSGDPDDAALGVAVADTADACAAAVAGEICRLLRDASVRDKRTGVPRKMTPGDIGILFRSRSSHREFERELGARGVPTYVYKGLGFFDADEIKDVTALLRFLADPTSHLKAAAFLRSRFVRLSDPGLARLAPDISGALLSGDASTKVADLDDEDRTVIEHARSSVHAWLALVDRVPPAELLEGILSESAYAFELRGPRRRQAWENLKKLRSLIRRMQNGGYATLPRVADHLMSLSAGDESNAVIEALDSVNLMTVHAAKGLEFPVVFVVNLAKGASAPPHPVRVVANGGEDGPSVSIGPFISDTDEAERERERHETRRLLYVALTRARDRLYLATTLKDGSFVPGRGSLAEILPDSLKKFFSDVPATFRELNVLGWTGVSGREYRLRLCRPPSAGGGTEAGTEASAELPAEPRADDFAAPAHGPVSRRMAAAEYLGIDSSNDPGQDEAEGSRSSRLLGVLIHRLFESPSGGGAVAPADASTLARRLIRPDELAVLDDPSALADRAGEIWQRARTRTDVVEALSGIERLHEVSFSMTTGTNGTSTVVRGTIDCLVRKPDGRVTVVEFKTGRARASHRLQLDLYVRAARALAPAAGAPTVDGVLIYL